MPCQPNPHDLAEPRFDGLEITVPAQDVPLRSLDMCIALINGEVDYEGFGTGWKVTAVRVEDAMLGGFRDVPLSDVANLEIRSAVRRALIAKAEKYVEDDFIAAAAGRGSYRYQAEEDRLTKEIA